MATTAGPSSRSSPLPSTTTSTLWAHLLHHRRPSKTNSTQIPTFAQLTPQDKASTSTRILLHDTQARLEKFSERANTIFSEVEASRREMVRVREEVEGVREKEFEAIVQLVNRCQSLLQKAIGDPAQAREAASIQANLTLALERLNALDDKINGRLDSLTALFQTQSQTSQSLQEQFSCLQGQQSRILELLAPLHPMLQSVPLHIDVARNAIIEKIPEGCQCTKSCSGPALSSDMSPPSMERVEVFSVSKKRRRLSLDTLRSEPRTHMPVIWGSLDTDERLKPERQQMPHCPGGSSAETENPIQDRKTKTLSSTQTPSGRKNGSSGSDTVTSGDSYPENVRPVSGHAVLANRSSPPNTTVGGKGKGIPAIPPPITVFRHTKRAMDNTISYISRPLAVPGKRFILFDDDDDDDDDGDI